jgi:hypothetical protein
MRIPKICMATVAVTRRMTNTQTAIIISTNVKAEIFPRRSDFMAGNNFIGQVRAA